MGGGRKITINNVFRSFEQKGTYVSDLFVDCFVSFESFESFGSFESFESLGSFELGGGGE